MSVDRPLDAARRHGHRLDALLLVDVDEPAPDVRVVRPDGDVDLETAPVLRAALARALADGVRVVVVDLDGVRFLGSTGVQVLLAARAAADESGAGVVLAGGQAGVLRILRLIGVLHAVLAHAASVEEWLAPGAAGS